MTRRPRPAPLPVSPAARLAWAACLAFVLSVPGAWADDTAAPPAPPRITAPAARASAPAPVAPPEAADGVRERTPASRVSPGPDGRPLGWTLCACVRAGMLV